MEQGNCDSAPQWECPFFCHNAVVCAPRRGGGTRYSVGNDSILGCDRE